MNPKDKVNSITASQSAIFLRRNKITQTVTWRVALGFDRTLHYISTAVPFV
jgi:hypothetical protein